jgi:hypothetical protein
MIYYEPWSAEKGARRVHWTRAYGLRNANKHYGACIGGLANRSLISISPPRCHDKRWIDK